MKYRCIAQCKFAVIVDTRTTKRVQVGEVVELTERQYKAYRKSFEPVAKETK